MCSHREGPSKRSPFLMPWLHSNSVVAERKGVEEGSHLSRNFQPNSPEEVEAHRRAPAERRPAPRRRTLRARVLPVPIERANRVAQGANFLRARFDAINYAFFLSHSRCSLYQDSSQFQFVLSFCVSGASFIPSFDGLHFRRGIWKPVFCFSMMVPLPNEFSFFSDLVVFSSLQLPLAARND